jgi:hypothetical protein
MPSLRDCLGKAGKAISPADAEAMHARAKQYLSDGHPVENAERMAVEHHLSEADKKLDSIYKQAGIKRPEKVTAPEQPTPAASAAQPKEEPTHAVQKPSPREILQREPSQNGEAGGESGRVEQSQQGAETAPQDQTSVPREEAAAGAGGKPATRGGGESELRAERTPEKASANPVPEEIATHKEPAPKPEAAPESAERLPPAMMKSAERLAELKERGVTTYKGKALEDLNGAESINALGKVREGKLLDEPPKLITDRALAKVQSERARHLKSIQGKIGANNFHDAAYQAALHIAELGLKAARPIEEVLRHAIALYKARNPKHSAEDLAKAESGIREALNPETDKPEPTKSAEGADHGKTVTETPAIKQKTVLSKVGDAWSRMKDEKQLKQVISANRDAVEGKANLYAAESKNEIRDSINRFETDKAKQSTAEDALRFYIESDNGNATQLKKMREKIAASTKASPKWKQRALDAIDYAAANGSKLKEPSDRFRRIMGEQLGAEKGVGLPTLERDNYVPRQQDVEDGSWLEPRTGGGSLTAAASRKNRSFETTADSVAAGIDPKTLNAVDSMTARLKAGMGAVHLRSWHKALYDMHDPATKAPVAMKPERVERADGSYYYQPPKGYSLESLGNAPVAIKKEYAGLVSALTDPSWWEKNKVTILAQKANANAKAFTLAVDTFHLGRLAFRSTAINMSHPQGFKVKPTYQKGLLLADHSAAEITRMAASGEIPKENLQAYLEKKKTLDKLVSVGYNIGSVSDAMHQEMIQSMPILGTVNKFIFQKFQRGAMAEAGILEFNRQRLDNPKLTDEQVARKVSKELMTRFGNLGRQGLFKGKTAQDTMRMMFLSPQWNEGLIMSEIGGVKQIGQAALNLAQGKKAAMGLLGREMITTGISLFVANQIVNQITRGKFTWENPEEGWGAKISAWIPDKLSGSSGFFFNPMGLAAETSHLLLNTYERANNTYDPLINYLRSRASATTRALWTFFTGKDYLGRTLKPSDRWEKSAEDALPAPISGGSAIRVAKGIATGGKTEKFPGEFQKQAMQSFGVRTDKAPSPEQRISGLAHEFNIAHGKEQRPPGEISDYQELTDAVRRGNDTDIKSAIDTLLEKRSAEDLEKYYRTWQNRNFTGSGKNEASFLRTLNPEQRGQYVKAHAERTRLGNSALKAISRIPMGKRAGPFAPATEP